MNETEKKQYRIEADKAGYIRGYEDGYINGFDDGKLVGATEDELREERHKSYTRGYKHGVDYVMSAMLK